jgi:EAL domain-containing protein (putative c-di-GMP-specific phosphodiesterase class I)
MQRAKRSTGGSYQVFDPELHQQVVHRMRVSAELRRAITMGEIVVYYQPIVSLRTGEITGAEALARWKHSTGLIQPHDFIPAAEEQGLVGLLGECVLQDACQQMMAWHQAGFAGCSISVNVSAQQFRDSKFLDAVTASIARSGLDPAQLKLELTEGTVAEDPEVLALRLLEFKRLGVDVLLDDFGTGYSSLCYLTRFPIHKLKIDRTFVQRAPNSPHDATIATTIVAMAHSLGYGVIAEGVETQQQRGPDIALQNRLFLSIFTVTCFVLLDIHVYVCQS